MGKINDWCKTRKEFKRDFSEHSNEVLGSIKVMKCLD
jgi:hypothetical protein